MNVRYKDDAVRCKLFNCTIKNIKRIFCYEIKWRKRKLEYEIREENGIIRYLETCVN